LIKINMKSIPLILMVTRLIFGFVILLLSFLKPDHFGFIIISLIVLGVLTDIFDGIIARRLNISTQKLRRLDSSIDQVFWICTLIGTSLLCPDFFKVNSIKMIALISAEVLIYIISYVKFKKEVATHAILSKIWTLTLMGVLIQIVLTCNSNFLFNLCFYLGIISRVEIMGILLILKRWTNDVPSIYHAVLLRQGKTIKRNKLFNG